MSKTKSMYYVYHIPKIKIGMTKDLGDRVFEQQGYEPEEVELLFVSRDMAAASKKEIEYQKFYGYPIDRQSYKSLMKKQKPKKKAMKKDKFKINVTDMTTTFPCYAREIVSYLMDNRGRIIELNDGQKFVVNDTLINWCKDNARTSMYTNDRCYVYNKALAKAVKEDMPANIAEAMEMQVNYEYVSTSCGKCIFPAIRSWAHERGLYEKGDVKTQYVKLQEEAGEVARAIIKNDIPELKDGIGDMVVVLTNLAHLAGLEIEDCIQSAYDVISKRKGSMINGSFVKNETL
jgi:NTP pyrophosphatase (non-canonical NTP hydrolase)